MIAQIESSANAQVLEDSGGRNKEAEGCGHARKDLFWEGRRARRILFCRKVQKIHQGHE